MKDRAAQACSACRRRKVKCNGERECDQCVRLHLKCIYPETKPDLRSRRSTVRGRVIESCFEHEVDSASPVLESPSSVRSIGADDPRYLGTSSFDINFFMNLVPDYSTYVLPTYPIIPEADFVAAITRMSESRDAYSIVHSIAAVTWAIARDNSLDYAKSLYARALEARGSFLSHQHVTLDDIMISIFTAKCLADLHRDSNGYFYYLHDAITRLQILRVDDPDVTIKHAQRQKRERLYWLLFIQERFDAICNFRPAILSPLPSLPDYDPSLPPMIHTGFIHLIKLFRMVDTNFVKHRLDRSSSSIDLAWIREKQAELGSDVQAWEKEISCLSVVQQVDLSVTRHWLSALVWQMSLQKFPLSLEGRVEEDYMSILFPIRISHNLRSLLSEIPRHIVEIHSTGILYKIFEIAATSADVLENVIARTHDTRQQADYMDDYIFLWKFLTSMSRFDDKEKAILQSKSEKLFSLFPWTYDMYG